MKKISSMFSLFLLAFACASCGNNTPAPKAKYNVTFLNLDDSEICSSVYEEGHTIVPPDDILDYDIVSECHRYIFKGFYDGSEQFKIGTKATKDVTYKATFNIKDKHIFNTVDYSWGTDAAHESECSAQANCATCSRLIKETGWSLKEMDKETPCFDEYHYHAYFNTIGFEEQYSSLKRTIKGEHTFTKNWAKDYIGNSGKFYCDKCGDLNPNAVTPKAGPSIANEVNFAFDKFGAKATLLQDTGAYHGETKELTKAFNYDLKNPDVLDIDTYSAEQYTIGYAEIKIELPRIKYSLYQKVSMDIEVQDAQYGVTFKEKTWVEPGTSGAIQGLFIKPTLEIEFNSFTNEYDATLRTNNVTLSRGTSLESSIVNGTESLVICVNSMFFRGIKINNLVLNNK